MVGAHVSFCSTSAASIGGDWGNGSNFTGSLDELAFYGSALTATQVANHYAARVHRPLPQAYRHQAHNANGNTIWTGSIYSSQDPAKLKVRFPYIPEGWRSSRISDEEQLAYTHSRRAPSTRRR